MHDGAHQLADGRETLPLEQAFPQVLQLPGPEDFLRYQLQHLLFVGVMLGFSDPDIQRDQQTALIFLHRDGGENRLLPVQLQIAVDAEILPEGFPVGDKGFQGGLLHKIHPSQRYRSGAFKIYPVLPIGRKKEIFALVRHVSQHPARLQVVEGMHQQSSEHFGQFLHRVEHLLEIVKQVDLAEFFLQPGIEPGIGDGDGHLGGERFQQRLILFAEDAVIFIQNLDHPDNLPRFLGALRIPYRHA